MNALQKEINYSTEVGEAGSYQLINRLVLCMVLLHLYRGDCVAADRAYKHAYAYVTYSVLVRISSGLILR